MPGNNIPRIPVPSHPTRKVERNRAILDLRILGQSKRAIADYFKITPERVGQIQRGEAYRIVYKAARQAGYGAHFSGLLARECKFVKYPELKECW